MRLNSYPAALSNRPVSVISSLMSRPSNVLFGAREPKPARPPLPELGSYPMAWWPLYQREVAKFCRQIDILAEILMQAIPAAGWQGGIPRDVIETVQSRVGLASAEILPTLSPEESEAALAARRGIFAPIANALDTLRGELSGPAAELDEELDEFRDSLEKTLVIV